MIKHIYIKLVVLAAITAATITVVTLLPGCAIPIPPTGSDIGKYGIVRIGVAYTPSEETQSYITDGKIVLNPQQ